MNAVFVPQTGKNDALIGDFQAFKDLMNETGLSAEDLAKEVGDVDSRIVNYAKSTDVSKLSTDGFKNSIGELSIGAKAGKIALQGLALVGNALAMAFASWVATEIISWLNDLAHAEENARKRSEELTSSYETEKKNIDDSIKKYKELSEKLDDTSLSTSEVKSIKEQLLDIQDQLNEKYGAEATQIDLVNGKYDEQIKKLDALAKKKAGDYVAENYSDIKADEKYVSEKFNVNKSLGFKGSQANPDDYSGAGFDFKKYLDRYDKLDAKVVNTDGQYGMSGTVNLVTNGTRQEVYDQISSLLQDLNNDFGESNPDVVALKTTLSNILTDSFDTDELANANSRIKKYAEAEILSNDKASKSYNDLVDAVDNYNTALETGKGVDEAKQKLLETKQAAEDSTKDITNSGKVLQDVYDSLSNEAPIEFQVEVGKNVDEDLQKSYDDTINRFKSDASSKELDSLNKQLDEQTQKLNESKEALEEEYSKISDWGLDKYSDQIKNGTIQSQYGNVDMDNRQVIDWNIENIEKWKDALQDIKYYDDDGNFIDSYYDQLKESAENGYTSIDTVFGDMMDHIEGYGDITALAFSHVVNNDDGTFEFLGQKTAEEYLYGILDVAKQDGDMSINHILELDKKGFKNVDVYDAQGKVIGQTYVHGIISGFNDNAPDVSKLTHFSGKYGGVQLAQTDVDNYNKQIEETKKKIEEVSKGFDDSDKIKDFFDTEGINTQEEIDEFNKVTEGIKRADDAIQKWNEHKKEGDETPISSFEEAWKALDTTEDENLKDTKKDLLELANAGQLSANTLSSVQGAEEYFKKIGLSAQDAANKVNELVNSSSQLSSMRSGITSITGALDTKASEGMVSADKLAGFDASVTGLETWDQFEEALGSSTASMEDCKKAANELATEYVNSNNFLSQLNDTNKDYYISQLQNMGVTNATEVVNASLVNSENALSVAQSEVTSLCDQQTDAKKRSYAASIDLSNATAAELQYLYNEANASGTASNGLRQLLAAKYNANNVAIASAADCAALAQIYASSESTKQSLLELAKAKAMALSRGNGGGQIYAQEKALGGKENIAQRNINAVEKSTKVDVKVGGGTVSGGGGGGGSKSKTKATKTEIDWLERAMTRVGKQIDIFKAKLENLFTVDTKKNNIAEQLKLVNKEVSIATKQVSSYDKKANNVKLSKNLKKAVREGRVKGSLKSLIAKYGEKTANKITTYQDWYDKARDAEQQLEELKTTQRELQEQQYQIYVDDAQANIDKLNSQKDISAGYTTQNQKLDDQIKYIKTSYEYQIKIAELTKDENKKTQLQAELTKELRDLEKEKFENIKDEYSSRISLIDAEADAIQSRMDQIEARGQIVGASYYESQIGYKNQDKTDLEAELSALNAQLALMEKAGDIGTKNWYDAKSAIADVQKQIMDCDTSILNMNNSITEVANTIYDKVIAGMKKFSTEADFMVGLMDDLESFDELSHTITDVGLANLGSYFTGKESSQKQAETTKSIVEQMKKNLANGDYSYTDALGYKRIYQSKEQMQDAIDSFYENWRDQINQTKEYNSKIIDFMRNKLQQELSAVQDLIDAKKEALSAEKDYKISIFL